MTDRDQRPENRPVPGVAVPVDSELAGGDADGHADAAALRRFGQAIRSRLTPRRLGALVGCIVLSGLIAVTLEQVRTSQLQSRLVEMIAEGRAALTEGDFARAAELLASANDAAEKLAGDTPDERAAVQLYREAVIWSKLALRTPDEVLDGLGDAAAKPDTETVRTALSHAYVGRTLVFDGWVSLGASRLRTTVGDASAASLDWSAHALGVTVVVDLADSPALRDLSSGEPARAVFGTEIAAVHVTAGEPPLYVLRAQPERTALLTLDEPFVQVGWPMDDSLREQLDSQREREGREP